MSAARDHRRRRAGARAAGDLRRRARLGALLPDRVRARRCGARCGRRASRTGWWPAATARSTRCGSRRATASGAPTSRPDETPYEGGLGFCVKLDKEGGFIGREALVEAAEQGPRASLCCLMLEDPRSVALGNEPVRVGGEIAGRVTTGGYGYTVERSIAYAYLPPEQRRAGHGGGGRDLRALGRRARWRRSRCSTRRASGSGPERAVAVGARVGHQPGEDVLGALDVLAHQPHRAAGVALRSRPTSRRCWAFELREHLVGVRDAGDQVAHLALDLGHGGDEPRASARPRPGRCGSARRRAGSPRRRRLVASSARSARRGGRGRPPSARSAGEDRGARSPRPRGSRAPPGLRRRASTRRPVWPSGGASATNVPPARPRSEIRCPLWTSVVSAWRRVEREMLQLVGQVALGGQAGCPARGGRAGSRCPAARRSPRRWSGAATGSKTASRAAPRSEGSRVPRG